MSPDLNIMLILKVFTQNNNSKEMTIVMKRCFSSVAKAARIVSCPDKLVYPSVPMHQFLLSGIEENLDAVVLVSNVFRAVGACFYYPSIFYLLCRVSNLSILRSMYNN